MIYANVRSIRNKLDEILCTTSELRPDLLAFSETWLTSDIADDEIRIPGYQLSRADRSGTRAGGGVMLYWRSEIKAHIIETICENGVEMLWCRLHDGYKPLTIGVVYKAPSGNGNRILDSLKTYGYGRDCLILGDFNAPGIDWDLLHCRLSAESFDASLLGAVLDANMTQHVSTPTRILQGQTPHILDLVLSPVPSDVSGLVTLPPIGCSDHCTLFLTWSQRFARQNQQTYYRNFWRSNPTRLRETASMLDWNTPPDLDVDSAWTLLRSKMNKLIEQVVPNSRRKHRMRGPPWIDREIRLLMDQRKQLWDRFKTSKTALDYSKYQRLRNLCTLKKREKRQQYELSLAEQSASKPKKLYAYINKRTKVGCTIPALLSSVTDSVLYEDGEKADLLAQHYSSVYAQLDEPINNLDASGLNRLEDIEIDSMTVGKLLHELDPNSSPGPDGLHPLFLKTVSDYIATPICQIFQLSLETGRLPADWKRGIVMPKHKGGDPLDPMNYRPICLTSIISKVMEKIVKRAIQKHCSDLNITSTTQHGFQKGRSCTTNLLVAREKWARSLDTGHRLDVVFVDFSKAFDKVPHQRLLRKLRDIGVSGRLYSWIADFLGDRTMQVRINETLSLPVAMTSGVPQGSVLGPELFKLFINDLPETLQTECLIYADDLKLWSEVSDIDSADEFQAKLDLLYNWSIKWGLPINFEKCCVLPIGASEPFGIYHIGGFLLRNAAREKDLGVLLTSDLKTTQDTLRRVAAANRMWGAIRRSFSRMTPKIFRLLFTAHVRPILEYSLPATYPLSKLECVQIERVQRRGSKFVSGLRDLSYSLRLQEMNLFSLDYRRRRGDLIYTRRILRGELGNELQQFFQLNIGGPTRGHNWKVFKPRILRVRSAVALSSRVINDWNSLPESVVSAQTEECFKRLLDFHLREMHGSTAPPCLLWSLEDCGR